jgi:outer membrane protein assembly factor BamB
MHKQRIFLAGSIAVLVGGVAALAVYHHLNQARFASDPVLLQELQGATLSESETTPTKPGDWPAWRGPLRDGISRETGLLTDWPENGLKVVWQAPAGTGYSSMAVVNGRLYTMFRHNDEEQVVCLDAYTGQQRWVYGYPTQYRNEYGGGPRSTPAVEGDRVYAVGATGLLSCINANTGKKVWDHDLLAEFAAPNLQWGVSFSPLVIFNMVFVMPGGPGGKSLAAFNASDGRLIWQSGDDPAGYSSPILTSAAGVSQLLCFTGTALVSVKPSTGQILWRFPWETDHRVNATTPLVRGDYVFISSGYGKGCALLKVVAEGNKLEARPVYQTNGLRDHHSGSVLWGEHIYGFDEARLTCLDFRTGQVLWKERGFGQGTLVAADGHLFILSEDGKLAIGEARPDEFRKKASFKFSVQRCWTMPVIADGRLFVRDEEKIVCYDLRKSP